MRLTSFLVLSAILFISSTQSINAKESGLSEFFKRSEEPEHEWVDITTALMMQGPDPSNRLTERDHVFKRDTSEVFVKRDPETGKIILPRSWHEVQGLVRRHLSTYASAKLKKAKHHASHAMSVVITWYTGHDLLYPSCVTSSDWAPTDDSMVAAVTIAWSDKPACGKFVKIRHASDKEKSIVVRIMDSCGGCASGIPHIDLTKAAFTGLYELDVGLVSDLQATMVDAPVGYTWTDEDVAKYGPHEL
ncbi:secreted protein [Melampsora americana]|nr:secreted protein [Melampsora americana]